MSLHRLTRVVMGVPNVAETAAYYEEFGLDPLGDNSFGTRDGGEQLKVVYAPTRRLVELGVGVDNDDDVAKVTTQMTRLGVPISHNGSELLAQEPISGFTARVHVAPRIAQEKTAATPYNGPGRIDRLGRAPGVVRETRIKPRKLGHTVIGTVDLAATMKFFTEGIGFKVSDYISDKGAFMRCSVDHHNVLALAAPVNFLHHTSWQVDDIDDVGRGAKAMLETTPIGTSGASAATTPAPTSSGTSKTPPATSPSTTPTWTASPKTKSGPPKPSTEPRASSAGDRPRRRRSWHRRISLPS